MIGLGWSWIVVPLMQFCADNGIAVSTVKEKFGGLRFYYGSWESPRQDAAIEELGRLIADAERLAEKTCEMCGSPGALRAGWWLQTLCDDPRCWPLENAAPADPSDDYYRARPIAAP